MTSPPLDAPPSVATLHAAVVYDNDRDLQAQIMSFLMDGLARHEKVVAIVPARTSDVLSAALGSGAMMVQWGLPGMNYRHLGRAAEKIRGYLADQRAAGEMTRLLIENDLDGSDRGPGRLAGYLRCESAANDLYDSHGFPWLCLYDRRRYSPGVLADVERIHPHVLDPKGLPAINREYVDPGTYLSAHPGPVSVVPSRVALDLELTDINDLGDLRGQVSATVQRLGLEPTDTKLAEVAAGEVMANAFRHGTPPGRVRVWHDADAILVRVDSGGPGPEVATSGFRPPDLTAGSGAGLWVARQLADVVHVETRRDGTTVELQFPL
jgi:anti-sigma regulatory factor (Ser/Thr protein kinase)